MALDQNTKEIVKAIGDLTKEIRKLRKVIESWDEIPPTDDDDPDKYIL